MKVAVMVMVMVMGSWSTVNGQFLQVGQIFRGVPYGGSAQKGKRFVLFVKTILFRFRIQIFRNYSP